LALAADNSFNDGMILEQLEEVGWHTGKNVRYTKPTEPYPVADTPSKARGCLTAGKIQDHVEVGLLDVCERGIIPHSAIMSRPRFRIDYLCLLCKMVHADRHQSVARCAEDPVVAPLISPVHPRANQPGLPNVSCSFLFRYQDGHANAAEKGSLNLPDDVRNPRWCDQRCEHHADSQSSRSKNAGRVPWLSDGIVRISIFYHGILTLR